MNINEYQINIRFYGSVRLRFSHGAQLVWRLRTWIHCNQRKFWDVSSWSKKLSVSQVPWNPEKCLRSGIPNEWIWMFFSDDFRLESAWSEYVFWVASKRCLSGVKTSPSWRQIGFLADGLVRSSHSCVGWNYAHFAGLKKKVGSNCADSKWEIHHGSQW